MTGAGAVTVAAPRVNDKRVDPETVVRQRFSSAILPAWARKSPKVAEVLPLLNLHGLSSLDFAPALEQFLGSAPAVGTQGEGQQTITRLTTQWQDEARLFADRSLSDVDYVYLWVDGIHVNVRLEQEKLCLLVMIGVRTDGKEKLIALTDGYRKPTESWAGLLRDVKRRGMRAPVLAMGDGAFGSGPRRGMCSPRPRAQRCWFHKSANVLSALPKSAHPAALRVMQDIYNAEDGDLARTAAYAFADAYGVKFPKAVAKIIDDLDVLLEFYNFPAEHWVHLRTTNPSVLRDRPAPHESHQSSGVPRRWSGDGAQADRSGPGPAAGGERTAAGRPVRAGATFHPGKLVERPDDSAEAQVA